MENLNWSVQQRMRFIEFSVYWEDEISRPKLQSQFSISPQQATKDLNKYQELAPNNIIYNPKRRRYVATDNFKPHFIEESSSEYLRHIDALRLQHKDRNEIWIERVPSYDCTHLPVRFVEPQILKDILKAINLDMSVEIEYVSLSDTVGAVKRITPHSICTDGNRWHTRAFNHNGNRFSDYSLSRISSVKNFGEPGKTNADDDGWNEKVKILVGPDDKLKGASSERLQFEYKMKDGQRAFPVRKAMLWYMLRRLGFNPEPNDNSVQPNRMRNESSFRLKLLNLDDVELWLGRRS